MKEKMIHPKRLAYFAEVFKCGSLNAAADRLSMVQAGIGRHIQLLEQELGVLLFERRKRGGGMVPTEAAKILYDHYCRYCDWQEEMEAAVCEPTEKGKVINAKRLFHFSQVFQYGSINAVADRLNRVQAGIGRQIQLLEQELGVRLFERGTNGRGMVTGGQGRGMVPTEAAETLYGFYHRYRDWQNKLEAAIEEWRSMKRGEIRIAMPSSYIDAFMDEFSKYFLKSSNLNIYIEEINSSSQIVNRVLEDSIHIGIAFNFIVNENILCYSSQSSPICMVVNKGHPLANKKKITFSETVHYPIALPPPEFSVRQMIQLVECSEKIQLMPALITSSASAQKKFASNINNGGTFMSAFAARQEIEAGLLKVLEVDHQAFNSVETTLIVRRGRLHSPATNQLLRLIAGNFSLFRRPTSGPISNKMPLPLPGATTSSPTMRESYGG